MKPFKIDRLTAVRLKLQQLEHEIRDGHSKPDLLHTLSKLGQFLADAVGRRAWNAAKQPAKFN